MRDVHGPVCIKTTEQVAKKGAVSLGEMQLQNRMKKDHQKGSFVDFRTTIYVDYSIWTMCGLWTGPEAHLADVRIIVSNLCQFQPQLCAD